MRGFVAQNDIVDSCGVDVAQRIALIGACMIGISGLGDVIARCRIVRALYDRNMRMVIVGKVADDLRAGLAAVVGIPKIVESPFVGGPVSGGCAVYVHVHPTCPYLEG